MHFVLHFHFCAVPWAGWGVRLLVGHMDAWVLYLLAHSPGESSYEGAVTRSHMRILGFWVP